jgi:hypothetical protein
MRLRQRGAGAHGERDVGRAQHGGVVDAVAHHRHHAAAPLQLLHKIQLVGGQVAADRGSMPSWSPTRRASASSSPLTSTTVLPRWRK